MDLLRNYKAYREGFICRRQQHLCTHLTSVYMEMDCDSTGVNKYVDKNSETEGSRYLEGYIRAERGEVYSGNGTIQVDIDPTAEGQSWKEHFVYRLSCNDVGWHYVSHRGN